MAQRRLPYPLTVPSNFSFVPQDGPIPRTPERPIPQPENAQPSSMPAARFRVRRHTGSRALSGKTFSPPHALAEQSSDVPIPSIEVAVEDDDAEPQQTFSRLGHSNDGYLSPLTANAQQNYEMPTTPVLQTVSFDGHSWKTARQREIGESIIRPLSSCSNFSSSSDDSDSSSTFASSYGGTTCTSPERGQADPFTTPSKEDKYYGFSESLMAAGRIPNLGQPSTRPKTHWTQAMDNHLWTTYQFYLQDPTVTPLKIVPGNAPPLGVCHRVARRAKQTWREPKLRTASTAAARFSTPQPRSKGDESEGADRKDLERNAVSDHESNPKSMAGRQGALPTTWPKQNATRRRLRELAKNRPTVPTHYMRLIANRSPSPFAASSSRSSDSRQTVTGEQRPASNTTRRRNSPGSPNLGTRGVRLALATATSETMQPDGPLARLQRETPEPTPQRTVGVQPLTHFNFNDEPAVQVTSASPELRPMIPGNLHRMGDDHVMSDASVDQPPRLGSPFVPNRNHTWAAPARRQRMRPSLVSNSFAQNDTSANSTVRLTRPQEGLRPSTSTGPRSLRSPIQFTSTFPYNRSLGSKRRAENSLEDIASPRHNAHRRPALNDVFGPPLPEPSREGARSPVEQRRVRLRGFSLNDAMMQSQQDRQAHHRPALSGMPESDDPFVDATGDNSEGVMPGIRLGVQAPRQLGSPFQAAGRPRFRVRHLPHNSLDSYPPGLFGSIGERLGDI